MFWLMIVLGFILVPTDAPVVTLTPLGMTSLRVSWEPLSMEKARGEIVEYRIMYRKQEKSLVQYVRTAPGHVHEYILSG